jgi:hypothetical protein
VDAMEELNTLLANSLDKYFRVLAKIGYKSNKDVYGLITLIAINQILNVYNEYITEDDMRNISNALYCIGGTCLIDFPTYLSEDTIFHEIKTDLVARTTQNITTRNSEDGIFRAKI